MELLDRYLQAVRRYLPSRRQDDIIAELRANMESQIEDKEGELNRPLTQLELEDLLRKMGSPMLVASRYQPQQYLIGPTIFPLYLYVLRTAILWAFIVYSIVISVVIPLVSPDHTGIFESLLRMPGVLINVAAWVTLVFVAIEFFTARYPEKCSPFAGLTDKWNPSSLPPLEKEIAHGGKRRSFAQAVAELIVGLLFLGWLLAIPRHPFLLLGPGAVYLQVAPFQLAPIWWIFFWCVVGINVLQTVWKCIDLARGTWQVSTRIQHIAFKIAGLVPILLLFTARNHVYVTLRNPVVNEPRYGHMLDQINNSVHLGCGVLLAIIVLQLAFDLGKWAWEGYRQRAAAQ